MTDHEARVQEVLRQLRELPTVSHNEIDGEESDGTPRYWRSRPFVSLRKVERIVESAVRSLAGAAEVAPQAETLAGWKLGEWFKAESVDEMQRFYRARLPAIREAAREHGYAIGVHGSERRDFDLIACPWREGASDPDTLAHAVAMAACGITRQGPYDWTKKPLGRVAVSIPVCWTARHRVTNDGHIDLSVAPQVPQQPTEEVAPQAETPAVPLAHRLISSGPNAGRVRPEYARQPAEKVALTEPVAWRWRFRQGTDQPWRFSVARPRFDPAMVEAEPLAVAHGIPATPEGDKP
jgi:hypothetical protein